MRCFYESGVWSGTGLGNRIRWKEVVCVGVPFGNGVVYDFGGQVSFRNLVNVVFSEYDSFVWYSHFVD